MSDKSTTIFAVQETPDRPYNEQKTRGHRQWRRGGGEDGEKRDHI